MRALTAADVPHELVTYPDAPHSFFDRKADQYADASADAWRRVLDFVAQVLGGVTVPVLSRRALNRALLARQMLLERVDRPVVEVVEHLVPMQAQVPIDPYVALWSRIRGFDPLELSGMLERREAARGTLHRATLHLATKRDFLELRPLVQPVAERGFRTGSPFGRKLVGLDMAEVLGVATPLLDERPRTKAELRSAAGPLAGPVSTPTPSRTVSPT